MKKQLGKILVSGALLVASAPLLAQYNDDHGRDHGQGHDQGKDHGQGHGYGHQQHYRGMHDQGQHEGWYRQGGRVPENYRGGGYVVNDWRHSRLREPPRGYHYVRSDNGDFLLVAISTGIIASIIASH
jgi:Ni/Co efflux regulator RcnB